MQVELDKVSIIGTCTKCVHSVSMHIASHLNTQSTSPSYMGICQVGDIDDNTESLVIVIVIIIVHYGTS